MSYLEASQRLGELYADSDAWARKAILNVASSGKFLQRPHYCRIRDQHLERGAVPGPLKK